MKPFIIFALLLLAVQSVSAQSWRLVKYVKYQYDSADSTKFHTKDSTQYTYDHVSGRGGLPNDTIKFNEKKHYTAPGASTYLRLDHEVRMSYKGNNDFHYNQTFGLNAGVRYLQTIDSYYYTNGRLTNYIRHRYHPPTPSVLYGYYKESYNYDGAGNLIAVIFAHKAAPLMSWMAGMVDNYRYDGNNRLIADSSFLAGQTWPGTLNRYTYDANGRRDRKIVINVPANDTNFIIYYSYDNLGRLYKDSLYDPNTKEASTKHLYYYYSQNNLLKSVAEYDLRGGTKKVNSEHYYYEMYWPNSIASTSKKGMDIQLYPNPAVGVINITVELQQLEQLNCTISDMQGRTLLHWTDNATKQYKKQIPIHTLPSGIYMLNINGEIVQATRQFVVR